MTEYEVVQNLRRRAMEAPGKHIMMTWEERGFLDSDSWCKVKEVGQVRAWGQFVKGVKVAERARLKIGTEHIGTVTKDDEFNEEGFTFAPSTFITGHAPEETKMENEKKPRPVVVVESEGLAANTDVYVLDPDGKKTSIPFVQGVVCKLDINDPAGKASVQLVMPKVKFKTTYMKGAANAILALFSLLDHTEQDLLVQKLVGEVMKGEKAEPEKPLTTEQQVALKERLFAALEWSRNDLAYKAPEQVGLDAVRFYARKIKLAFDELMSEEPKP